MNEADGLHAPGERQRPDFIRRGKNQEPRRLPCCRFPVVGLRTAEKQFLTVILTFEELNGQTKYIMRVHHWTEEDREAHDLLGIAFIFGEIGQA